MANIVTKTSFVGCINLNTSNPLIVALFDSLITQKEVIHIERLFGKFSAKWIYENAGLTEGLETPTDLLPFYNGGYFTDADGNDVHFDGLVTILAYYLYCDLLSNQETVNTNLGNIAMKERKSTYSLVYERVSGIGKQVANYNTANFMYHRLCDYIVCNETLFPDNFELTYQESVNIYGI